MTLFRMLIKLLAHFRLATTEERQQLQTDIEAWEDTAVVESDDKLKSVYGKIHKGVFVRLLLPFGFFFLVRYFKEMISDESDPFDND